MQETLFALQLERMNRYHDAEAAFQRQQCGVPFPGDSLLLLGYDFSKDVERLAKVRSHLQSGQFAELESDALLPPVVVQEIQILLSGDHCSPERDAQVTRLRRFYTADLSQN